MLSRHATLPGHRHSIQSRALSRRCLIRVHVASPERVATDPAAAAAVTRWEDLPSDLRNATAVLEAVNPAAPGGKSKVFLLGVSHVSKVSCDQVKRLVRAVRPDVVMVELCKERTALLVDADNPDRKLETWHCRQVSIEGLPATNTAAAEAAAADGDDDKDKSTAAAAGGTTAEASLWPEPQQLLDLLSTRIGAAVTTQEIEVDVSRLLATGLFGKARPAAASATRDEAPQFGAVKPFTDDDEADNTAAAAAAAAGEQYTGEVALQVIPPLGALKFVVEPRKLPLISIMDVRLDSSLRDSKVTTQQLQDLVNKTLDAAAAESKAAAAKQQQQDGDQKSKDDKEQEDQESQNDKVTDADNSLVTYLKIRSEIMSLFSNPDQIIVSFSGVESGRLEVLVRARRDSDPGYVSGLEGSAVGGEGLGIDSFRPQRQSVQLSPGMLLPAEAAERLAAARAARQAERSLPPPHGWRKTTESRFWSQSEVTAGPAPLPAAPVVDFFAQLMTGVYGRLQSAAGDCVGISSGAAWRAAMEAACEVGAQQVLLGDRPTNVTQRRLATSITAASGGRLAAALGLLVTGVITAATNAIPDIEAAAAAATGSSAAGDAGIVAAAAAGALALAWPVLSPFFEVWQFGKMDAQQIEDTVAITQPLKDNLDQPFFVWGEDALLKWPGAVDPLITERDEFMAKVVAAAAAGTNPNVPAYIADEDDGQLIWRYMMPDGSISSSAPAGLGDGPFKPLSGPSAVVAVVGSAHVRGMVRQWENSLAAPGEVEELMKVE